MTPYPNEMEMKEIQRDLAALGITPMGQRPQADYQPPEAYNEEAVSEEPPTMDGLSSLNNQEQEFEPDMANMGPNLHSAPPKEQLPEMTIYDVITSLKGPSKAQIEKLKKSYGAVYVLPIDAQNVFIYRPLKRQEWMNLKAQFNKMGDNITMDMQKEKVVSTCLIWPVINPIQLNLCPAGLIDTLYESIMIASQFLSTQMIISIAEKL